MIELDHPLRLVFPERTREDFVYLPMSFVDPDVILGPDMLCISGANPYMLGVLESSVHRAWIRAVGRFEDGFLVYDPCTVYNNFPWPRERPVEKPDGGCGEPIRQLVSQTAQGILDARAAHPGVSLGVLYSSETMPVDLRAAHEVNDAVVLSAYGLPPDADDVAVQTLLFTRYAALVGSGNVQCVGPAARSLPHGRFHASRSFGRHRR